MSRHELFVSPDCSLRLLRRAFVELPPAAQADARARVAALLAAEGERAQPSALARAARAGVWADVTDAERRRVAEERYL